MATPGCNEADKRAKLIDPALHASQWIELVKDEPRATHGEIHREQSAVRVEIIDGKPFQRGARERFLGTRFRALELRDELERLLADNQEVVLDFKGVETTQSFIDEWVGVLVLERGPGIIEQLVFRSCSEDMKTIIHFVLVDRIEQQYQSRFTAQH